MGKYLNNCKVGLLIPILMLILSVLACDLEQSKGYLDGSQLFEAAGGWDYEWISNVIAGEKYQVTVRSTNVEFSGSYMLLEVTNGLECQGCLLSTDGAITSQGLSVIFIGPKNGKARIYAYVRDGKVNCIIEIKKVS